MKKRKKKRNKDLPGTSSRIRKFPGRSLKWKEQAVGDLPLMESLFEKYLNKARKN